MFKDGNHARLIDLLSRQQPAAGAPDRRHLEWFYLWRAANLHERMVVHGAFAAALDVSDDGTVAATGGADGSVQVWEIVSGRQRLLVDAGGGIADLALSPDATLVAAATRANVVRVYDVNSGGERASFDVTSLPATVQFLDRAHLAVTAGRTARVFDLVTKRDVGGGTGSFMTGDGRAATLLGVSPTEYSLLSASGSTRIPIDERVRTMGITGDGAFVISSAASGAITVFDRHATAVRSFRAEPPVSSWILPSIDGRYFAAPGAAGLINVWDTEAGRVIATLPQPPGLSGSLRSRSFSPSARWLAVSGETGVMLFDVKTRQVTAVLRGHTGAAVEVAFTPDETRLLTRASDSTKVWRLADVNTVEAPLSSGGTVLAVAAERGGRWIVAAHDAGYVDIATKQRISKSAFGSGRCRP
jgi:WD40 repeat protein